MLLRSPTALLKPALLKPTVVATADLLQLREVLARDIHLDCTVDLLLSGMLPNALNVERLLHSRRLLRAGHR